MVKLAKKKAPKPILPCAICRDKGGYAKKGESRPYRCHGLCGSCSSKVRRRKLAYAKPPIECGDATKCVDCGTSGGYRRAHFHRAERTHGRCTACYGKWHHRHGRSASVRPAAPPAVPWHLTPTPPDLATRCRAEIDRRFERRRDERPIACDAIGQAIRDTGRAAVTRRRIIDLGVEGLRASQARAHARRGKASGQGGCGREAGTGAGD